LAITLIVLSILSPLYHRHASVYRWTTGFTLIPALFDALGSAPAIVTRQGWAQHLLAWDAKTLPMAKLGMDWVVPALIGLAIGLGGYLIQRTLAARSYKTNQD